MMSEHHHRGPWAVWVGAGHDRNGEPYELRVGLADERHVTEEDAEWLRRIIRNAAPEADAAVVQAIIGLPMRLKAHRAARGLSQRHVARVAGVSFATVSRIEAGEDYMVSNLIALATYLDGAP